VLGQSGKKSTAQGGGEKNPADSGRQHPFKGGGGDATEGGSGKVGQRVEGYEEGGPGSHRWGTARVPRQRPAAARPRRARAVRVSAEWRVAPGH
jgi:hypothetical protein